MSEIGKASEHHVELDGQVVVCQRREVTGQSMATGGAVETHVQYSFDRGKTWHRTQIDAYRVAQESGNLMAVHEPGSDEAGEYEAFVLALLAEIGALKEGERLILVRLAGTVTVVKEQAVLAVRASTIKEIDLRMEGSGG